MTDSHHPKHPTMALVRDPWFWRRFSRAVHLDEEVRTPTEEKQTTIWSYVPQASEPVKTEGCMLTSDVQR